MVKRFLIGMAVFLFFLLVPYQLTRKPDTDILFYIDMPATYEEVPTPFILSGWALDRVAEEGVGIDEIQVYEGEECSGVLLGEGSPAIARPDVIDSYDLDDRYMNSGFEVIVTPPAPGLMTITTCIRSTYTEMFQAVDTRIVIVD